jgi:hypothetical protein
MAYAPHRSMNSDLAEGMTDGKYKKVVNNRGGFINSLTNEDRELLSVYWYNINETPDKVLPDGSKRRTEQYVPTQPGDITTSGY